MELKFTYVEKSETTNRLIYLYHFEIITDDERHLYFHTYDDLSGFQPNFDITQPRDFITLGVEILANMEYIKEQIKKHRRGCIR